MSFFYVAVLVLAVGPSLLMVTACLFAPLPNRSANALLAAAVAAITFTCTVKSLQGLGYWAAIPDGLSIPSPLGYLVPPLIYLYLVKLLHPGPRLSRSTLWHFLPFAVSTAIVLPVSLGG